MSQDTSVCVADVATPPGLCGAQAAQPTLALANCKQESSNAGQAGHPCGPSSRPSHLLSLFGWGARSRSGTLHEYRWLLRGWWNRARGWETRWGDPARGRSARPAVQCLVGGWGVEVITPPHPCMSPMPAPPSLHFPHLLTPTSVTLVVYGSLDVLPILCAP